MEDRADCLTENEPLEDRAHCLTENEPLENRADRLTKHVPQEAGFFACLCSSSENTPGKPMLKYCCYPSFREEQVRKTICSAFDVFRYDYGHSLEPLCPGDMINVALRRGLVPSDDTSEGKLQLR